MTASLPFKLSHLEPLGIEDVKDILEFNDVDLSVDEILKVFQSCAGNPLILRLMISEYQREGTSSFEVLGSQPESVVRKVIDRAVKTTDEALVFDILGLVHIAPGHFSAVELGEILLGVPSRRIRAALEALGELLVEVNCRYSFFHKTVHDYLDSQFSPSELEQLHAKIVGLLEPWEEKRHPYTPDGLIIHLFRSGQREKALDLLESSEYRDFLSQRLSGNEFFLQVIEDWEIALNSIRSGEGSRRVVEVITQFLAQYFQYFHDNALLVRLRPLGLEKAIEDLAIARDDKPGQALCWFLSGTIAYHHGEYATADDKFARSQQLVESIDGKGAPFRFRIYQFRGLAHQYIGKFEEALRLYRRSGEVSTEEGSKLYRVFSKSCAGNTYAMMGRHEEAVSVKRDALELLMSMEANLSAHSNIFSTDHFRLNVASALTRLAESSVLVGLKEESHDLLERAETIYESVSVRDRYYLYFVQVVSAAEIDAGELDRPEHRLWETLILARSAHSRGKSLRLIALILAKRYLLGDHDDEEEYAEVRAAFDEALSTLEKVDAPTERMLCLIDLKEFLLAVGEESDAAAAENAVNYLAATLNVDPAVVSRIRDSRISIPDSGATAEVDKETA